MSKMRWMMAGACALMFCGVACTDDQNTNTNNANNKNNTTDANADMVSCFNGERFDPVQMRCIPIFDQPDQDDMTVVPDMNETDMPNPPADMGKDDSVVNDPCDRDLDGYRADTPECGGDDCNDEDPFQFPGRAEICDGDDNNCDGNINEGIECEFFANSRTALYKVDPFKVQVRKLIDLEFSLHDMDTHPVTGALYGIDADNLYRYEPGIGLTVVGRGLKLGNVGDINGLAIDRTGKIFATGTNRLYEINNDSADTANYGKGRIVGEMVEDVTSSGDCVINKGNTLFMTSKKRDEKDSLVRIDHTDSSASATVLGNTGYSNIYGLTAAWGKLYGVNSFGELIEIDERTGAGTLLGVLNDPENPAEVLRFYGAASSPSR